MKKCFFLFLTLIAFSCSDNDSDNDGSDSPYFLITKLTQTIHDGESSETYVTNFEYDSMNNLSSYTTGSTTVTFEYDGNKVLNQKRYTNGLLSGTFTFNYEGDRLTSIVSDDLTRSIFTYTGAELTSVQNQFFDEDVWETNHIVSYEYSIGNVTERNEIFTTPFESDFRVEYLYDNKLNPARHMNEYLRKIFVFEGIIPISVNNPVSMMRFTPSSSTTGSSSTFDITYHNIHDFPILIKKMNNGVVVTETEIEYFVSAANSN